MIYSADFQEQAPHVKLTLMKRSNRLLSLVVIVLLWEAPAMADYTLVLKNGRRITAKSYHEDGSMIKIQGLGGEFGIPKDQIQTILKAGETQRQGLSISDLEASTRQAPAPAEKPSPARSRGSGETLASEEAKATANAEEEREYQRRLAETTRQLEDARQHYFTATQGGGTSSSATKEGYKAWTADLMSRLKDRRGASPSEYEPQERELSDLRNAIDRLQKDRDALIEEMRSKNIQTEAF